MNEIMKGLEAHPFTSLNGNKVKIIENYFSLTRFNLDTKETSKIEGLPKGDLIKFIFEDGSNIEVRPSGTEPKCKFYIEVVSNSLKKANELCETYYKELLKLIKIKA